MNKGSFLSWMSTCLTLEVPSLWAMMSIVPLSPAYRKAFDAIESNDQGITFPSVAYPTLRNRQG
jgi:hypothetical protein